MPCPNISISPSECAESLSGISSTFYIGPIQPDGSLPKKEDMIAMEIPDDYTLTPLTEEDSFFTISAPYSALSSPCSSSSDIRLPKSQLRRTKVTLTE